MIFPQQAGKTQDFTDDRAKLIEAIDKFDPPEFKFVQATPLGPGAGGADMSQRFSPALMRSQCQRNQPTVPVLDTIAARLATVPNRRKTIFLVSVGIPIDFVNTRGCPGELNDLMFDVFRKAQRANINIYGVDPAGYRGYEMYLTNPIRRGGRPAARTLPLNAAQQAARRAARVPRDHRGVHGRAGDRQHGRARGRNRSGLRRKPARTTWSATRPRTANRTASSARWK